VGQKDPLMEFKHEAFLLFERFTQQLRLQTAQALFRFEIVPTPVMDMNAVLEQLQWETDRSLVSEIENEEVEANGVDEPRKDRTIEDAVSSIIPAQQPKGGAKMGRNELCSCNSGKKYKKCCGML
jgi:preprotein translocase subunit SecA